MKPGPAIPILPVLSGRMPLRGLRAQPVSVLDVGRHWILDRGASAIRLALEHAAIGSGDEVLVPAFHCPSMVWPVAQAGAAPVFYRIGADLRVSPKMIEEKLTARTRAVLVPHFFGQLQDMPALRALCDERHMVLIEDCAHAFFGSVSGMPIGSLGHYAIASPRKFFPVAEGGLLASRERNLTSLRPAHNRPGQSVRIGYDMVDSAVRAGRLRPVARLLRLAQRARSRLRPGGGSASRRHKAGESGESGAAGLLPVKMSRPRQASVTTRITLSALSHQAIRDARRKNYELMVSRLAHAPGATVVALDLPSSAAPYMVPVVLRFPDLQFQALKAARVPMWRWEYSVRGVCPNTDRYADSLIQLPCHQDLDYTEVDAICGAVLDL